jgi:hypothetical protein
MNYRYSVYKETNVFRLAAATEDYGLHLLTKSHDAGEVVFPFGGRLSGHHGRVNGMCFTGGDESTRYVATVSGTPSY